MIIIPTVLTIWFFSSILDAIMLKILEICKCIFKISFGHMTYVTNMSVTVSCLEYTNTERQQFERRALQSLIARTQLRWNSHSTSVMLADCIQNILLTTNTTDITHCYILYSLCIKTFENNGNCADEISKPYNFPNFNIIPNLSVSRLDTLQASGAGSNKYSVQSQKFGINVSCFQYFTRAVHSFFYT